MESGETGVDMWRMSESSLMVHLQDRNIEDVLMEDVDIKPDLDQLQIQPRPIQWPSTSAAATSEVTATSSTSTSTSTSTSGADQQDVCILHWEDETTADRLTQTLGGSCRKVDFNSVIWETHDSFSSLYILVNDRVADKFSKERMFETLDWIDGFAALGRQIYAVKCTDNEYLFNKTFYRLPQSPEIYKWPTVSQENENKFTNSHVQIGLTNQCVLKADDHGIRYVTQITSSTNIVDVNIGNTENEDTVKIVLTTINDVPGLDKKLFTVFKDNKCMINTYLPTEAGATVVSVERGSVILNLKLEQGVTLEEFLKVKLEKILSGCLRPDVLSLVGGKLRLDVKVHSKLTVDMIGNLATKVKKELEHKETQTNIRWVGKYPQVKSSDSQSRIAHVSLPSRSSTNSTSSKTLTNSTTSGAPVTATRPRPPVATSSTQVTPVDVKSPKSDDTTSNPTQVSDQMASKQPSDSQQETVSKGISAHKDKTSLSTSIFRHDPEPAGNRSPEPSVSKSQQLLRESQETSEKGGSPKAMPRKKLPPKYDTDESMAKLLASPYKASSQECSTDSPMDQGSTYAPKKLDPCWKLFRGQLPYFERPKGKIRGYFKIALRRVFDDEVYFDTVYIGRSEDVAKSLDDLLNLTPDSVIPTSTTIERYVARIPQEEREKVLMIFWVNRNEEGHNCKAKSMLDCMTEYCGTCPECNSPEEIWSEDDDVCTPKKIFPSPKRQISLIDLMRKRTSIKEEPGETSELKKIKIEHDVTNT